MLLYTKDIVIITILTIILSVVGTIAGVFMSLYISKAIHVDINAWIVVYFAALYLIHEMTHYTYLYAIGAIRDSEVQYRLSFKNWRIWLYTDRKPPKRSAAAFLILPAITTIALSLLVILNSLNASYSGLLGYALALSSLDLFLLHQLRALKSS